MRRPIRLVQWLALVLVFLRLFVPAALAQECPALVGFAEGGGGWYSLVAASGRYAYVVEHEESSATFVVVDVGDPAQPLRRGEIQLPYAASNIEVSGHFAYVSEGQYDSGEDSGLRIIDVADPDAPILRGFYPHPSDGCYFALSGDFAYVTNDFYWDGGSQWGLHIVDVSDPDSPIQVGYLPDPYGMIEVSNETAYVVSWGSYVDVIDVHDPRNPVQLGSFTLPHGSHHVEVIEDHLYYAWSGPGGTPVGLSVIDVSDPSHPVLRGEITRLDTTSWITGLAVSTNFAYLSYLSYSSNVTEMDDQEPNLWAIDVSDLQQPAEAGHVDCAGGDVAVFGVSVYATGQPDPGFFVFRECPMFADSFESGDTSAWSATVP